MNIAEELNYESMKERLTSQNKTINKLLINIINAVPRETLIKVLKKKKIIKRDWEAKGEKYETV